MLYVMGWECHASKGKAIVYGKMIAHCGSIRKLFITSLYDDIKSLISRELL